ncbi:hypothetical protein PENTCL1PPCAC_7297, partial [Pristionchus entomophagus]
SRVFIRFSASLSRQASIRNARWSVPRWSTWRWRSDVLSEDQDGLLDGVHDRRCHRRSARRFRRVSWWIQGEGIRHADGQDCSSIGRFLRRFHVRRSGSPMLVFRRRPPSTVSHSTFRRHRFPFPRSIDDFLPYLCSTVVTY